MKKNRYFAIALAILLLLGTCLSLGSCAADKGWYTYDAEGFEAGALQSTEQITKIEIYWINGEVTLSGTLSEKITAIESYIGRDEKALRYSLKDGVLKIYPSAPDKDVWDLSKDLIVKIPYDLAKAMESVTVETVGASVLIKNLGTDTLTVKTVQGDVSFTGNASESMIETQSGNLKMELRAYEKLRFDSKKGNADLIVQNTGFTAVLRNKRSAFETTFDAHQNGNIYTFGNQKNQLLLTTKGKVTLTPLQ